ncbi:hypothetical protein YC2023_087252 [Brassica napus]
MGHLHWKRFSQKDYKSFITRIISQGRFTTSLAAKQLFHTKAENILQEENHKLIHDASHGMLKPKPLNPLVCINQAMFVYLSRDLRPAICDLRLIASHSDLRLVACRKPQVVVRFDVARLIARPVTGFHSSRPKKQRLKIKKILILRLVAGRRSQVVDRRKPKLMKKSTSSNRYGSLCLIPGAPLALWDIRFLSVIRTKVCRSISSPSDDLYNFLLCLETTRLHQKLMWARAYQSLKLSYLDPINKVTYIYVCFTGCVKIS